MNEEFKNAFNSLSINEKRNQISNELLIIGELIKIAEKNIGIPSILMVKNYDSISDSILSESEMLDFIYEDIYNIQKELITLLSVDKMI